MKLFLCLLPAIALMAGSVFSAEQISINATGINIGDAITDRVGFYGTAPIAQRSGATQGALTDSTGGSLSNYTLADGLTVTTLTDSTGGSASGTLAAVTNIDTLGGTLTGTLDNTLADLDAATAATVAGTLTGSADGTLADVAAIALSTSDTYSDAAVNAAVNTAVTDVNLQLKELQLALNEVIADNAARKLTADKNLKEVQAELVAQRAANTAMINALASLAAKVNTIVTDITTQNTNDAKIARQAGELRLSLMAIGAIKGGS